MCVSDYGNLDEPTPQVKLTLGITFLFFTMLGILGNIVMLVIVLKVLRSRRTLHNVLIFVLAVTDLLTICLAFPPAILAYLSGLDVGHAPLCDYHGTVLNFFYIISVILVTLMSLDRYLALSRPFFYKNRVVFDSKTFVVIFTCLCIFALLVSLLPVFGLGGNVLQYPRTFCLFQLNARDHKGKIVVFLNLLLLMLCLVTVVGCNSAVSWTSLRMLERSQQRQRSQSDITESGLNFSVCSTEECQFLKLSVIVAAAFLGCWSLFFIRTVMIQFGSPFNTCLDIISVHLVTLHTICNPWIYLFTRRQYRKGFWYIVRASLHYITCKKLCLSEQSLEHILGIAERKLSSRDDKKVFNKQTSVSSRSASLKHDDSQEDPGEMSTADRDTSKECSLI